MHMHRTAGAAICTYVHKSRYLSRWSIGSQLMGLGQSPLADTCILYTGQRSLSVLARYIHSVFDVLDRNGMRPAKSNIER